MKARLPVIFLFFIFLLLFPNQIIYAQETSTPSANKETVTSQDNPITKLLNSLISLLTKNKTPQKTGIAVNSSLPPKVVSDGKEEATAQEVTTLDVGGKKEEDKTVDPGVLDNTSASYHIVSAFSTKSDEKVSGNILDELRNLLDKVLVKDKGNEKAMEFVAQELPGSANTDILKPQSGETITSQSRETLTSQGINIGGFISNLFKSKDQAMVDSIEFRRCMELPGSVCTGQLAAIRPSPSESEPTPTVNQTPGDDERGYGDGICETGIGSCSVDNLTQYFGNTRKARKASQICNKESGSNPFAKNKGCLTHTTYDYSIGLFQINLLAHCPQEFASKDWDTISCVLDPKYLDPSTNKTVCEKKYEDSIANIQKAVELSGGGINWNPWSTTKDNCQIANGEVSDLPPKGPYIERTRFLQCGADYSNYPPPPPANVCTICQAGCGPVALSNILYNLYDNKYTPKKVLDDYYGGFVSDRNEWGGCNGTGITKASNTLIKLGFEAEYIFSYDSHLPESVVIKDMKNYIDAGWQIFATADFYSNKSNAWIGHHYWITDIDDNNHVWVVDSYYGADKKQPMDQSFMTPMYRHAFAFRKPAVE